MNYKTTVYRLFSIAVAALLAACAVGPNYEKPATVAPKVFKEQGDWMAAQPADDLPRGAWWEIFADPALNDLESQIETANQSLAQAQAQYGEARALVGAASAAYFPSVSANASRTRSQRYGNSSPSAGSDSSSTPESSSRPAEAYSLIFDANWEPDVWGRVRRSVEAQRANAQANVADLESVRLSLHAQLAQTYFQLRIADEQQRLLNESVAAYQKSFELTENQYKVGVAARANVVQADTQLKSAQVQAIDLGITRAQLEHAIAVLVGKAPADFSIPVTPLTTQPPAIPILLPSQLLQRRPDVAAAERRVAAANAQIGVAESAFFPSLGLSASGGYQSSSFAKWLTAPSRVWSLGPALAETLFDGGARRAQVRQAQAAYEASVANYRETALTAFQNVEDYLAALRILEQEGEAADAAVKSAQEFLRIATNQYRAGTVSYLDVVTAQNAAYNSQRSAINTLGTRLIDSVALIKAIGGAWDAEK